MTRPPLAGIDYPCRTRNEATPEVIDVIYDTVDRMLLRDQLHDVDDLLDKIVVEDTATSIVLSYLTITLPFKTLLPGRTRLAVRARSYLTMTHPKRVDAMMGGLD